ncbi:MAG: SurA N-terminal domain-containing protein [Pseudomonadota bacterium]
MMDRFREGLSGPVAWAFLIVIVISFVFSGVSNFFVSADGDKLAEVDGIKVSRVEFDEAYQNQRQRYGEMFGQIFNTEEKELDFRRNVLEQLVTQKALAESLNELNLRISKERIKEQIQAIPQFQRDGKYDRTTAEMVLTQAGYSPERFSAQLEKDLVATQMLRGLADTGFALASEAERFYVLENETLTGRFARLSQSAFLPTEAPADSEIEAYYSANASRFAVPEKFNLQYVELKADALAGQVAVTDADLEAYYQQHQSEFTRAERRKLAHILFTVPEGADSAAEAAVKSKAEAVLAEARTGDFAALAQSHSDDEVSKAQGGELGVLEKGAMDPAFDEAAFALTREQPVSALVRTAFGYHIIKLLDIEGGEQQTLDSVREQVREAVQAQKIADLYAEKELQLTNVGYESADSLDEAANAAGLTVKETGSFERSAPIGIAANPTVMEAVVADEVLVERRNSAVLSIGDQHAVMVRIKDYSPATTKPLADVRGEIITSLNAERAKAAAKAFGDELLAKAKAGEDIAAALAEKNANWQGFDAITRASAAPDPIVREQLFKLARPNNGQPTVAGVSLTGGDYLLAELQQSHLPAVTELDETRRKQYVERLSRFGGEAEYMAYIQWLKAHADIEYFDSRLQPAAAN